MKQSLAAIAVLSVLGLTACGEKSEETQSTTTATSAAELDTPISRQSYSIGASMGSFALNRQEQLEGLDMALDMEIVRKGFNDALNGEPAMSMEEMQTIIRNSDQEVRAKQEAMAKQDAEKNIAAGQAYLVQNAEKEGVTVTESGLQYEVMVEGTGAKPAATDIVKVHYKGTLIDGTEFDSSYSRGEPAEFPLNRVIPGWTEGVQLMSEGSKFKFVIPAELAYGERATGSITPNSTLIFEVELLDILNDEAEK
ncbi:MAG: FKBP-type 22 kDa peptidyl-prolyl cis-trans isomerase [Glaciecola sp. HTCC2999]|nr:MAG: FKBP-type 22 kDa peptidyl-prolyl cis-trans isomerase [Glaciecola sp. HTCC2999]